VVGQLGRPILQGPKCLPKSKVLCGRRFPRRSRGTAKPFHIAIYGGREGRWGLEIGYIYSPFDQIPDYAPPTRYVFVPVMVLSGLWMWKGHVLRRPFSQKGQP
jgi:hypothetical protein